MPQSSPWPIRLPAFLLGVALCLGASPVAAQGAARLSAETTFHKDPGGVRLVTLNQNTQVTVVRARGNWTEVTVEGWIWSRSLGGTTRDGFNLVVTAAGGENIRLQADGQIIGRAVVGALFDRDRIQGGWTRVRRTGWVASAALPSGATATAAPAPPPPPATVADTSGPGTPLVNPPPTAPESPLPATSVVRGTTLSVVPGGESFAELTAASDGRVVARQGDWVRVRLEGWVR
ncbi:MAG: hypothetical protein ABR551_06005, partial [Gemmatimonadales bacterium]